VKVFACALLGLILCVGCGPRRESHDDIVQAIAHSDSVRRGLGRFSSEWPFRAPPDTIAIAANADSDSVTWVNIRHQSLRPTSKTPVQSGTDVILPNH